MLFALCVDFLMSNQRGKLPSENNENSTSVFKGTLTYFIFFFFHFKFCNFTDAIFICWYLKYFFRQHAQRVQLLYIVPVLSGLVVSIVLYV